MKKFITLLFVLFVITLISSNGVAKKEQSKTGLGEAVFYEIFPSLIDSIHTDSRLMPPPPPEYFKFMDSIGSNPDGFEE